MAQRRAAHEYNRMLPERAQRTISVFELSVHAHYLRDLEKSGIRRRDRRRSITRVGVCVSLYCRTLQVIGAPKGWVLSYVSATRQERSGPFAWRSRFVATTNTPSANRLQYGVQFHIRYVQHRR
jgi:hypothetical protein